MAYDEEQEKRSRVVVETPNARREVVQSEAVRAPERDGISSGMVGVLVIVAIGLVTLLVLFLMSGGTNEFASDDLAGQQPTQAPQTTIIEQPAPQQPPVIIQQPAPVTQPPVIIQQPAPAGGSVAEVENDVAIQAEIDRRIADDPKFSSLAITATTVNRKVTLVGTVSSESIKTEIERMARSVKGVLQVDNQIMVTSG